MKSVVFTFGRMNPPTTGHQLLVNKLVAYARHIGAAPRVYLSHSVGAKDPLQYDKKVAFARAAFGSLVKKSNARTVIEVLKSLEKEGYTHVTMFAGSDRVPEFQKLLNKYNGKEYNFEKIEVKSAGERDPDADDVSGMSASKMRALAKDDKVAEFLRGAPNTLKAAQAKNMFMAVRKALLGEDVMEYGHNERFLEFIFESDTKEEELTDLPSDSEISKQFDNMSADELDLDDADAMMLDIILGDEEEGEKEEVKEAVLGIQQRQKLSQRMKAMSKRLARLRQIKAKQMPASQRIKMRARKAALMMLRKRATGKKNLDYNALSRSQRIAVDTALMQRFGKKLNSLVGRLATRLMPRVRKQAQDNVKKAKEMKEENISELFTSNPHLLGKEKEGSPKDTAQDKLQAAKRGISVKDWEKTKADAAHDSPLNVDATKLNTLDTDPTLNDRQAPNPKQSHLNVNKKLMHYARNDEAVVHEGRKSAADKDARDAGDTNIIYQMRKTVNSRGEHETTFADGKKAHISIADAKKMIAKFDALRLPADKHEFTIQAGQSLAKFRDVMAHGVKHEKKKISLGGRKFNEFYLGVGRSRTASAYDNDEPPGTRRIAEVAKDEDRPTDPNKSRPLSQKMDLLMRLGLVDQDELQKFRRALRSSKKFALQSPQLREKLADLLDKLIDLTTKDPATYSRVRYNVVTKEALSLMNKAEKSGVDVDIIFEVFARGYEQNEDINEAFSRVNSFIAGGKAAEMDKDLSEGKWPYPKEIKGKASNADSYLGTTDRKRAARKAIRASIKAKAHKALMTGKKIQEVSEPTGGLKNACWKNYTAVGMKMKNGRKVPNCVPKEQLDYKNMTPTQQKAIDDALAKKKQVDELAPATLSSYKAKAASSEKSLTNKSSTLSVPAKDRNAAAIKANQRRIGMKLATKKMGEEVVAEGGEIAALTVAAQKARKALANKTPEAKKKPMDRWDIASQKAARDAASKAKKVDVNAIVAKAKKANVKEEAEQVDEISSAMLYRAKQAAQKKAGWLMPGDKGKGDKAWNRVKKFRDAGVKKQEQERKSKKVNEAFSEQLSTHEPIPLAKRAKRVKGFHSWHPKPVNEIQRRADIKMIKHKLPDGRIVYRKERATADVQHEAYTGSEPVSGNSANPANRFVGTDAIRQNYASVTPGQGAAAGEIAVAKFAPEKVDYSSSLIKKTRTEIDQSKVNLGQKHLSDIRKTLGGIRESVDLNESFSAGFELAPFARDYGIQVQSSFTHHPEVQEALDAQEDAMNEAIYQGREVPLGKPMKGDVKKSKVYVRDPSTGNVKKVNFGDKKLSIKKDQPARKKSYCARSSGQGNLNKKTSANYWSRRAWDC